MCTTGSEDAVTVQAGTFSWARNEKPVLEKWVVCFMAEMDREFRCIVICFQCFKLS